MDAGGRDTRASGKTNTRLAANWGTDGDWSENGRGDDDVDRLGGGSRGKDCTAVASSKCQTELVTYDEDDGKKQSLRHSRK